MPSDFQDDKAPVCIPFILRHLRAHQRAQPGRPLFVGLNGVQGVGKTTLVALLTAALRDDGIRALVCSIDDFYLTRREQVALAERHPENGLWQHRGEPGTHDIPLAKDFFAALLNNSPALLPRYDKAAFSGQGDRLPPSLWQPINHHGEPPLHVVILEGWCVGFRPLAPADLQARYDSPSRTLRAHPIEHLRLVNDRLGGYDAITNLFDAFIHVDAEDLSFVYPWRKEQEDHLRRLRADPAAGMSDEQVVRFVDGYFPAYELYSDGLRRGVLPEHPGSQLRILVDRDRKVTQVIEI
ncbi:putative kinase mug58 [Escovopsis weberi]|uniref:Putative kinase mug58 n=1 Tax=Escovopsis weberi TaxID=150374 RepID=A0A0M9VSZ2_ESCWE|nr:putative kinase mug58 [Escovopsis weberi]